MRNEAAKSISDNDLGEVTALVRRGRAVPAVIVSAILQRLAAAEGRTAEYDESIRALAA